MNNYNIESITEIIISILQEKVKKGYEYKIAGHDAWDFTVQKLIDKYEIHEEQAFCFHELPKKNNIDNNICQ